VGGTVRYTPHTPLHTPHTPHTLCVLEKHTNNVLDSFLGLRIRIHGQKGHLKKKIIKKKIFLTFLKLKIYYAKWTLRIEVVNGKNLFIIVISEFI
jgi:hypothetical protein